MVKKYILVDIRMHLQNHVISTDNKYKTKYININIYFVSQSWHMLGHPLFIFYIYTRYMYWI